MRRTRYVYLAAIAAMILALGMAANAQGPAPQTAEASFDVSLHLVLGSNDAARGEIPADLAGITKQIKSNFGFANYRLASTFFGRISNSGSFYYKSVSNIFGQQSTENSRTFLDWSIGDFHTVPTVSGKQGVQAREFRFGAKVPVTLDGALAEGGRSGVQYESIGVNVGRFVVAQNTPTLVGTLNLPGTSGTIFLVMTVKSAD